MRKGSIAGNIACVSLDPVRALAVVIALLLAGGVASLAGKGAKPETSSPTPAPGAVSSVQTGNCVPLPARRPTPKWFPTDLPLPEGSYATDSPFREVSGYQQGLFMVPNTLRDFVGFVLKAWPEKGWVLGWGESEPFEAEDRFYHPTNKRLGAFRARSAVLCDPNWIWVSIALGANRAPAPST